MRLWILAVGCLVVWSGLLATDLAAKQASTKKEAVQTPAKKTTPADAAKPAAAKPEQAAEKKPEQPADKKATGGETPAVHTVSEGPLKIEVSLKGVFEAESAGEIILRPKAWKAFEVTKAVEPGTVVKKGDVLVQCEPNDLDEAIKELSTSQQIGELALKQAEENLRALEATNPLDLEASQRAKRLAAEDLDLFIKIHRPLSEKSANFMLRSAEDSLRNEKEELAQLEKMYKADDLTEETEEIVLKRQRDSVRRAEFYVEMAKTMRDQTLQVSLPREADLTKQIAARQEIAAAKAKVVLPLMLSQQRLEVEKLKQDRAKSQDKLKKLQADRAMMTILAPADGVVYYGQCVRGKWSGAEQVAKSLRRSGMLQANDVFMTIVKPRPMFVRANVPEKQIAQVRPGLEGKVEAAAYPGKRFDATVTKVDAIPSGDEFDTRLEVELNKGAKLLMPGMSCTVKFVPYQKRFALTVPASAVFADEWDEQKQHVYLAGDGGKHTKRRVTVGRKTADRVEILEGLDAGDRILLERPKSEKR